MMFAASMSDLAVYAISLSCHDRDALRQEQTPQDETMPRWAVAAGHPLTPAGRLAIPPELVSPSDGQCSLAQAQRLEHLHAGNG